MTSKKRSADEISKDETVTVGYWSIRGLGAPLRMMVMYANNTTQSCVLKAINYDLKEKEGGGWDGSEWFGKKQPLKEKNPLMNLPYVQDGDVLVSQSNACFQYLGEKLGLWGKSRADEIKCMELLCEVMDIRNAFTNFCYRDGDPKNVEGPLLKSRCWEKLELVLQTNKESGCFLVGNEATAPDFHLWEMLDQYERAAKWYKFEASSPLAVYPGLKEFYDSFASLKGNQKYLASALHKLPINNKMAHFGAMPSGGTWADKKSEEDCDFSQCSGKY